MEKKTLIYEGKAKKLYRTTKPEEIWIEYLDQATALNGGKKDAVAGKGSLNNQITAIIFQLLEEQGVTSHFIKKISKHEQLVYEVTMIPLEVVLRNTAAGSFTKRLGVPEGTELPFPIIEFYYKEDELDDPMINESHIKFLEIATDEEIAEIKRLTLIINEHLIKLFAQIDIQLIDFKLEFGRMKDGTILLADEISPDTCRLWDKTTNEHLDKDIYRRDLGDLVPVYEEVFNRLTKEFKLKGE